jgi:hypothetical protein
VSAPPPASAPARALWPALLAYAAASLFHHVHNATYLADYPNLPAWLTQAKVYLAWAVVTGVGLCGYLLLRRRHTAAGLAVIAVYAGLGLTGLDHYARAPLTAHSAMMNLSILLEVAAAGVLLAVLAANAAALARRHPSRA